MQKTRENLFAILAGVFCACLIISNILAFKTFTVLGVTLPAAVIIFPVVYVTNDMLAELFGFKKARIVIFTGFLLNVLAVTAYKVAIILPAPVFFEGQEAFQTVLNNAPRVLIASLFAYLVGSLVNAKIMQVMRQKSQLFTRCSLSTLCGEGLDAIIFISIAFYGTMPISSLVIMIFSQAIFKTLYEIAVYPLTKIFIQKAKRLK